MTAHSVLYLKVTVRVLRIWVTLQLRHTLIARKICVKATSLMTRKAR